MGTHSSLYSLFRYLILYDDLKIILCACHTHSQDGWEVLEPASCRLPRKRRPIWCLEEDRVCRICGMLCRVNAPTPVAESQLATRGPQTSGSSCSSLHEAWRRGVGQRCGRCCGNWATGRTQDPNGTKCPRRDYGCTRTRKGRSCRKDWSAAGTTWSSWCRQASRPRREARIIDSCVDERRQLVRRARRVGDSKVSASAEIFCGFFVASSSAGAARNEKAQRERERGDTRPRGGEKACGVSAFRRATPLNAAAGRNGRATLLRGTPLHPAAGTRGRTLVVSLCAPRHM